MQDGTAIEKLLSLASAPVSALTLATLPDLFRGFARAQELFDLLAEKNGFYAFESALHDAVEGMRCKANVAMQTRNLPDGAKVRLVIGAKPD
ncbi:MAG TPA: hypothetical protein VIY69_00535 [Candidatus Acidoferrales bacterium]